MQELFTAKLETVKILRNFYFFQTICWPWKHLSSITKEFYKISTNFWGSRLWTMINVEKYQDWNITSGLCSWLYPRSDSLTMKSRNRNQWITSFKSRLFICCPQFLLCRLIVILAKSTRFFPASARLAWNSTRIFLELGAFSTKAHPTKSSKIFRLLAGDHRIPVGSRWPHFFMNSKSNDSGNKEQS